jgi:hypothetical protein
MFSNNNPKLIEMRDRAAKLQVNQDFFFLKKKFIFLQKEKERDERKQQGQERKQKSEQNKVLNVIKV